MAIAGLLTNEGLLKCIEAASQGGWHIYPTGFAVSDELSTLSETRSYDTMNPTWYTGLIAGRTVINHHTVEFICTIPPNSTESERYIREIYVTAQDENSNKFLLCLGQSRGDAIYDPTGSVKLRIQISVQNLNATDLFVFKYTQAQEIFDHNYDPNAHPELQLLITDSIEKHSFSTDSHPYIQNLITNINSKLELQSEQIANVAGIQLPPTANVDLGQNVTVLEVNENNFNTYTYRVSTKDAKGSLLRFVSEVE